MCPMILLSHQKQLSYHLGLAPMVGHLPLQAREAHFSGIADGPEALSATVRGAEASLHKREKAVARYEKVHHAHQVWESSAMLSSSEAMLSELVVMPMRLQPRNKQFSLMRQGSSANSGLNTTVLTCSCH